MLGTSKEGMQLAPSDAGALREPLGPLGIRSHTALSAFEFGHGQFREFGGLLSIRP